MNAPAVRPVEHAAAPARSLPAWVYNHPEMTRLEYERILRPSWQIICHVSQLPNAGDYVTFELGRDSVVVLRDSGGEIRACATCAATAARGCSKAAATVPGASPAPTTAGPTATTARCSPRRRAKASPTWTCASTGWTAVRTEITLGFVFVCLAAEAPPPPSAGLGADAGGIGAATASRRWSPPAGLPRSTGTATGRSRWTTTSSPTTCRSAIPGLNRMFTPDYEDQRGTSPASRAASAGCASVPPRAGASGCTSSMWPR